jgi:hypothetical protein
VESADGGAESQAGQMLRVTLPWLSGGVPSPHWALWPGCQMVLLLDELQTDYSFLIVKRCVLLQV